MVNGKKLRKDRDMALGSLFAVFKLGVQGFLRAHIPILSKYSDIVI
jgi:hypothetical protein